MVKVGIFFGAAVKAGAKRPDFAIRRLLIQTTVILTDSPTALVIGSKSAYNVRTKFVRIKRVFGVTL